MKKVLIITYYWPPAGGPGVQRVLKFVKYLPQFGWKPVVLTVKDGEYPAIDKSLEKDIPTGIKVYEVKSWEPFSFYKKLSGKKGNIATDVLNKSKNDSIKSKVFRWIRANFFIPDARCGFISAVKKEGLKIIESEKPDLIFSSSPPHSVQVGAKKLAEKSGLKWVADFRDPWTDGFWQKDLPKNKLTKWYDLKLEISVLRKADHIISVSEPIIELLSSNIQNNYFVIPNGFDEDDFIQLPEKSESENFKITYAGSLRKSQIPYKFFDAISSLVKKEKIRNIELNFIGSVHKDALEYIAGLSLLDIVQIKKYIPHNKLLEYLISSDIALLLIPDTEDNAGILTGKIFEYLRSETYILGFGPAEGSAAKILEETDSGAMFGYDENPEDKILSLYSKWANGEKLLSNQKSIEKFSRKSLTAELVQVFNSTIG